MCGNAFCDLNESCTDCPADCGDCPVTCGDATCDALEGCGSCPGDCGPCACVADALEPNNGSLQATPILAGITYCGLSVCSGDIDWLGFSVTTGLTANLTFVHAYGNLQLEIYSAQTLDYVAGSYSSDDDESVTMNGLAAGTYWARIYSPAGGENSAYCFQALTF